MIRLDFKFSFWNWNQIEPSNLVLIFFKTRPNHIFRFHWVLDLVWCGFCNLNGDPKVQKVKFLFFLIYFLTKEMEMFQLYRMGKRKLERWDWVEVEVTILGCMLFSQVVEEMIGKCGVQFNPVYFSLNQIFIIG